MQAASLALIEQRALQKRVDTKQVVARGAFGDLFAKLADHYAVILSTEKQEATYRNVYFDTPDHLCLREHHRGRRPRFKVRIRHHVDRSLSFLEIKERRHGGITHKHRKVLPFLQEELDEECLAFINANSPLKAEELSPSLHIAFMRTTVVGRDVPERVTFDRGLCFSKPDQPEAPWNHGMIVEIKQKRYKPRSPIMLALRQAKAQSVSMSKYCLGANLLLPSVKMNRYKGRIRFIRRRFHE